MDPAIILAAVGIVVSVAIPFVISKREHPKRELAYEFEAESLLATSASGIDLTVMHDGEPVAEPYLATLTVKATGRADIASSTFDDRHPIMFVSDRPIIAEFDSARGVDAASIQLVRDGSSSLAMHPSLIKKGDRAVRRFLVEGAPSITVQNTLIDTKVVDFDTVAKRNRFTSGAIGVGAIAAVTCSGFIAALLLPETKTLSNLSFIAALLLAVIGYVATRSAKAMSDARSARRL